MPVIVVPTDFSPIAENAARYAAQLAKQTGAELHLVHFYGLPMGGLQQPPLMDGTFMQTPAYLLPIDEFKTLSEESMKRFGEPFAQEHSGVTIKTVVRISTVVDSDINDYCKDVEPFLIVMGSHPVHGIDAIEGSTTLSLVKHLHYPMIAVPEGYAAASFGKMVLASDGLPVPEASAAAITQLVQVLGGSLQIVHVRTNTEEAAQPTVNQPSFDALQPSYATIENEDVTKGLQDYLQTESADLLIVLPHHHNLWERLFFKLHTADLITHLAVPVLCIPEERR
ncbi:MAG: hypothetical protein JWP88_1991 [Flaviaesturariibacter sp.]|nr:hypothetical protein [Flaviaesturariibacter sp.]